MIAVHSGCSDNRDKSVDKKDNSKYGIVLFSNTSVRIDPIIFSAKVTQLKKGQAVQITEKSQKRTWVAGKIDYWYKIKSDENYSGWIFGSTIKILKPGSKNKISTYIAEFWDTEAKKIMEGIAGKWWSVNIAGDFTNHCLMISSDGKYVSYTRTGKNNKIEGEYNFDFDKGEINFLNDTTFKSNLKFARRGRTYKLFRDNRLYFKRIIMNKEDKEKKGTNGNKIK